MNIEEKLYYIKMNNEEVYKDDQMKDVSRDEAQKWNFKKASNVLLSISKKQRDNWMVEEVNTTNTHPVNNKSDYTEEYFVAGEAARAVLKDLSDIDSIADKVSDFEEYFQAIYMENMHLNKCVSNADLMVTDLLHYIEFSDLNVIKAFRAIKLLKNVLINRRRCKNALHITGSINNFNIRGLRNGNLKKLIKGFGKQQYTPRKLTNIDELISMNRSQEKYFDMEKYIVDMIKEH